MATKIYLRSIKINGANCLALYDSNGNGGINDLETFVKKDESKVNWVLDTNSGIKSITKIWSEEPTSKVFKHDPKKVPRKKEFEVELKKVDREELEKYNIQYMLDDGTLVTIDPYIRMRPPTP